VAADTGRGGTEFKITTESSTGRHTRDDGHRRRDEVAPLLSAIVPGMGQFYRGEWDKGLMYMTTTPLGYMMFGLPGLVLHASSIHEAR
jgi:hypothetical protein